jgi:uncharacterized protein (DUF983 family)
MRIFVAGRRASLSPPSFKTFTAGHTVVGLAVRTQVQLHYPMREPMLFSGPSTTSTHWLWPPAIRGVTCTHNHDCQCPVV